MLRRKPQPTRDQLLASIPVRNQLVTEKKLPVQPGAPLAASTLRLSAPLKSSRLRALLTPSPREKSFDLDALGAFVWHHANGTTSVESLIQKFADHHQLSLREAEISVIAFLKTLTQRNLIALISR